MIKHLNLKVKNIPLDDIVISKAHLHDEYSDEEIREIAFSISETGIIKPISVCPSGKRGKYVLLTGERYFLAYKVLNKKTIPAIVTRKLNENEMKLLNLSPSQLRQKMTIEDMADACSHLYKKYGYYIEEIAEKIGIKYEVSALNYECLEPKLKELVNEGNIDLRMAILVHIIFNQKKNAPDRN